MFKCEQCKRQSEPGETQFKRRKYRILTNKEGKKCGKEIVQEKKVCSCCYNKYGETIK